MECSGLTGASWGKSKGGVEAASGWALDLGDGLGILVGVTGGAGLGAEDCAPEDCVEARWLSTLSSATQRTRGGVAPPPGVL